MPEGSKVRQLDADERRWVIDKVANWKFWSEAWQRIGRIKLWIRTISATAVATLAWVRSDDVSAILSAALRAFGIK